MAEKQRSDILSQAISDDGNKLWLTNQKSHLGEYPTDVLDLDA